MRGRLGAVVLVALAACSDGGGDVTMNDARRFSPTTITVSAGDTISFVNRSDEPHTVTAYAEEIPEDAEYFASGGYEDERAARDDVVAGLLNEGESFEVTLEAAGTYKYFCVPHEQQGMRGRIVVE